MGALDYLKYYTYDDYKLWKGGFSTQRYDFDETLCKARVDFEKVFKRFRK